MFHIDKLNKKSHLAAFNMHLKTNTNSYLEIQQTDMDITKLDLRSQIEKQMGDLCQSIEPISDLIG